MYKTLIILFSSLLFASVALKAQRNDFVYFDSLTYKLYMEKDYKNLVKAGKEALHAGFDYYYLRMRIGIALYEQKKYRVAASHFEKALTFSDNDLVREYLYYSNIWGGEALKAQEAVKGMSNDLKTKLGVGKNNVLATNTDLAFLFRMGDVPSDFDFPKGEDGSQVIPKDFFNFTFGIKHRLGSKANMFHLINYLHKSNDKYTYYNYQQYYDTQFYINQFQYYLGSQISMGRNWSIIFAAHASAMAYPVYSDMGYYSAKSTSWEQDYVFSTSVLKNFKYVSLQGGVDLMYMHNRFVYQPSAILRLYPFANLNLYTESQFSYLADDVSGTFFQQQKLGFKVFKKLWLEGNYFSGSVSGFTLENGSLLFNGMEEINRMAGGRMIFPTGPVFTLSIGYQYRVKSNYFIAGSDIYSKSNKLELNYSMFYILLSWEK